MRPENQHDKTPKEVFSFMIGWRFGVNKGIWQGLNFATCCCLLSFLICENLQTQKYITVPLSLLVMWALLEFVLWFMNNTLMDDESNYYNENIKGK